MDRWVRAAATGAHLIWRVKNGARSLPARLDQALPDASAWVMLHESDQMLARRRKTSDDKSLTRLTTGARPAGRVHRDQPRPLRPAGARPAGTGC